jgi:hypothetical protein
MNSLPESNIQFSQKNSSKMTAPTDAVNDIENENCHHMPTAKNCTICNI